MWNDFPSFPTCIFYICCFFTPSWQTAIYFKVSEMTTHRTTHSNPGHARDHWWTLNFANAFVSPGVNSRAELVPSPRAYARNGAPHRWLGDNKTLIYWDLGKAVCLWPLDRLGHGLWLLDRLWAIGFASGNNGSLGSTKHTVSLGLSK
jgi:hypothetical protein